MTIKYEDGKTVEGFLLSRNGNSMRVALEGTQDVVEYIDVQGTWISENLETVAITFEWQKRIAAMESQSEDDFVCPPELASYLIRVLETDSEEERTSRPRHMTAGQNIM